MRAKTLETLGHIPPPQYDPIAPDPQPFHWLQEYAHEGHFADNHAHKQGRIDRHR